MPQFRLYNSHLRRGAAGTHNALVTVTMMTNVLKHMRSFVDIVNKNMDFFQDRAVTSSIPTKAHNEMKTTACIIVNL